MAASQFIKQLQRTLVDAVGYDPAWVAYDYAFADYLGTDVEVRTAALAAFSEPIRSYRTACIGVIDSPSAANTNSAAAEARALGAPRVVSLHQDEGTIWDLSQPREPKRLVTVPASRIPEVIERAASEWSPAALARTKLTGPLTEQLGFVDLGLIPFLDQEINEKLNNMILRAISACTAAFPDLEKTDNFQLLLQALLELLTAKLLHDRGHDAAQDLEGAESALLVAKLHYGLEESHFGLASGAVEIAWRHVREGFFFQNISVHALAYVYENTLVSDELRQRLGVHGTPLDLAHFAASLIPKDLLVDETCRVVEPFVGYGPFLLGVLDQLQQHLDMLEAKERHDLLVRRLVGVDLDPFALAICRLCLTLGDYPNPDGWNLRIENVFLPGNAEQISSDAGVILCNPPFEAFTREDRKKYSPKFESSPPMEFLWRAIHAEPRPHVLGVVIPRNVFESEYGKYRDMRRALVSAYDEVDIIALSDKVFEHSDLETVLVVARRRRVSTLLRLRATDLGYRADGALPTHETATVWRERSLDISSYSGDQLWIAPLPEIWDSLQTHQRLNDVADLHHGLQYFGKGKKLPRSQWSSTVRGVANTSAITSYRVLEITDLCDDPSIVSRGNWNYDDTKVVVNAVRRSRGPWCLSAARVPAGLAFTGSLIGVWSHDLNWPPELITAILNGPVANAWIASRAGKMHINLKTLQKLPLPYVDRLDVAKIVDLVLAAEHAPLDTSTALEIDSEVLKGYDLPPRREYELLRYFDDAKRVGLSGFDRYYPPDFESTLPLHMALEVMKPENRFNELVKRVPTFDDPDVSAAFRAALDGFISDPPD